MRSRTPDGTVSAAVVSRTTRSSTESDPAPTRTLRMVEEKNWFFRLSGTPIAQKLVSSEIFSSRSRVATSSFVDRFGAREFSPAEAFLVGHPFRAKEAAASANDLRLVEALPTIDATGFPNPDSRSCGG